MRTTYAIALLALVVAGVPAAAAAAPADTAASGCIVVLRDGADAASAARAHADRLGAAVRHVYSHALRGYSATSPHVAGGAALYLATHPGASPGTVKSALRSAGGTDWDNSDDGDNTKEPLLNVGTF